MDMFRLKDVAKNKQTYILCRIIQLSLFLSPFSCGFIFGTDNLHTQWVFDYKTAITKKDCQALKTLANKKQFRLKDVARIQAYKLCPDWEDSSFHWDQFPDWLKRPALEASFHRTSKKEDIAGFITSSQAISQLTPHYDEKVRYMIHAIQVAKKNNWPDTQKLRQELYTISPSRDKQSSDYLAIARDYKKRNLYKNSIYYYRKALNNKTSSIEDKQESFRQLRWLYKRTKNKKRYLSAVRQYNVFQKKHIYKNKKATQNYFKDQINLARDYWNEDQFSKALLILTTNEKKKRAPLDQIYWFKGKIYEDMAEHKKAVSTFRKGKAAVSVKSGEWYEKLTWSLVWNLKKLKQWKEALELLTELESNTSEFSTQYVFWKAQLLEELGEKDESLSLYHMLAEKAPFSFHGLVTHSKIEKPLALSLVKDHSQRNPPYKLVDDLILAGENALVLKFMKYKIAEYEKSPPKDPKELFYLFKSSTKAGFYLPFFQFIGSLPAEEKSIFIKKYAHILFPTIYDEEVRKANTLFDTAPEIIYSIMRQESAFNPRALSPARAVGLMQVLPSVAKQVAKKQGITYRRRYDLYDPKTNILIGTAHLQDLFSKHGGYFILNTAIYNAGRTPVLNWVKKFPMHDPIEFIQDIPYQETRTYVRLIIRNFIMYKLLDAPDHKIDFPNWILELPENHAQL